MINTFSLYPLVFSRILYIISFHDVNYQNPNLDIALSLLAPSFSIKSIFKFCLLGHFLYSTMQNRLKKQESFQAIFLHSLALGALACSMHTHSIHTYIFTCLCLTVSEPETTCSFTD